MRGRLNAVGFHVYILRNSAGRLYVGQTSDLPRRLARHNQGKSFWTKNRGPWSLAYSEEFLTRGEALARERELKALKSRVALERLAQPRPVVSSGGKDE